MSYTSSIFKKSCLPSPHKVVIWKKEVPYIIHIVSANVPFYWDMPQVDCFRKLCLLWCSSGYSRLIAGWVAFVFSWERDVDRRINPSWGGPIELFLVPVLHDWCNTGCGMYYPVCGMMHIKEPLLLIGKSSLCGGSGFPLSLSEWSLTICLTRRWVRR